eukprot:SAG11_NODE_2648_length_3128_cov_1.284252_3_plen_422_part_00
MMLCTQSNHHLPAVKERSKIIVRYLKTWFILDFVATFPWTIILEGHLSATKLQMVRMLRVFRCVRAGRILDRMTAKWSLQSGFVSAFKFFIYVGVVAHVLACVFYIWPGLFHEKGCIGGDMICDPAEQTIVGSWIQDQALHELHRPWEKYIVAMYWSITTMTTIGYGDIGPKLHEEKIFVIFAEVIGMAFFAMLVHEINEVKRVSGKKTAGGKMTKDSMLNVMQLNHIPKRVVDEVLEFLDFQAVTWQAHSFNPADPHFRNLSKPLQEKLLHALYAPILRKLPLFGSAGKSDSQLRSLFNDIDSQSTGKLDKDQLRQLLKSIGVRIKEKQTDQLLEVMDISKTGYVNFEDFQGWWKTKHEERKHQVCRSIYVIIGPPLQCQINPVWFDRQLTTAVLTFSFDARCPSGKACGACQTARRCTR